MQDSTAPRLAKLPFFFGNALLLLLAWLIFHQAKRPLGGWEIFGVRGLRRCGRGVRASGRLCWNIARPKNSSKPPRSRTWFRRSRISNKSPRKSPARPPNGKRSRNPRIKPRARQRNHAKHGGSRRRRLMNFCRKPMTARKRRCAWKSRNSAASKPNGCRCWCAFSTTCMR